MKFKKNKRVKRGNLILIFPIIMIVEMISFHKISAMPKTNNITNGFDGNGIVISDEIESRQWIMKNATIFELPKLFNIHLGKGLFPSR